MNKKKLLERPNSLKELAFGILSYNAISILGPMIVFVGGGLLLDNYLKTKPYLTIIGLIIAFILTNILTLKKVQKLTQEFKEYNKEQKEKSISPKISTNKQKTEK